ncbi:cytidylyltransferase domain-containing protein [Pseudoalteromonas prydzensis]|uniref:acylneuraminate cytidylyltransferase family protein n=1 Tax=Pseudoalteromonas prydzensis TaxID=182141 RepID=UPI003703ECA4
MINEKRILAIIPARGGSKRLPRKNVLPINGKPLIEWSIDAAKASEYIDTVFISTDDKEIQSISFESGAYVPELRPAELATDTATTESMLLYTLEKYGKGYDVVILLQPTSPLRTPNNIDEAIELFLTKKAFSVVSVTSCEHSPLWSNTLPFDGNMENFIKEKGLQRSQDLYGFYRLNGAIYIFDVEKLLQYQKICYTKETYAYKMSNENSVDIDTELDFEFAELLLRKYNAK